MHWRVPVPVGDMEVIRADGTGLARRSRHVRAHFSPRLVSAPASSSAFTATALPLRQAYISGVCPPGPRRLRPLGSCASAARTPSALSCSAAEKMSCAPVAHAQASTHNTARGIAQVCARSRAAADGAPSKFGNRMKPWSRLKAPAPAERAEEAWLTDRRGAARPTRARQRGAAAAGPSPHEVRRDASAALAAGSDNAGLEKLGDILQRTPLAVTKGVVGAVKGVGPAIEGAEAALGRILRPRSDGPPPQTPPAPSSPPYPPSAPPSPPPDPSPPPAPPTSPTPASPPSPPLLPPPPPPLPPNHPPGAANWVVSPLPATSALCGSPAGVVPTAYRAQATSFLGPARYAAATLPRRLLPPPTPRAAHRCSFF